MLDVSIVFPLLKRCLDGFGVLLMVGSGVSEWLREWCCGIHIVSDRMGGESAWAGLSRTVSSWSISIRERRSIVSPVLSDLLRKGPSVTFKTCWLIGTSCGEEYPLHLYLEESWKKLLVMAGLVTILTGLFTLMADWLVFSKRFLFRELSIKDCGTTKNWINVIYSNTNSLHCIYTHLKDSMQAGMQQVRYAY